MEGIGNVLSSIGSAVGPALSKVGGAFGGGGGAGTGLLDIAGLGMTGAVLAQNVAAAKQQQDKLNYVKNLINNPSLMAQKISSLEQPIQQGSIVNAERMADAYGAERGLGSSAPVMRDVTMQALAPLFQNQQQMAQQAFLQSLGAYMGVPTQQPANVAPIFQALMMQGRGAGAGGGGGGSGANLWTDPGINVMQPSYMPGGSDISGIPSITNIGGAFTPQVDVSGPGFGDWTGM
jgi:hypothetical protein